MPMPRMYASVTNTAINAVLNPNQSPSNPTNSGKVVNPYNYARQTFRDDESVSRRIARALDARAVADQADRVRHVVPG
jgi:hypothetical protein